MGGKDLFKSLALEDGESAVRRQELRRRKTAASMKRSAGKRKFMQMNVGSVVPKSNWSAGGGGKGGCGGRGRGWEGGTFQIRETLHPHPAGAETHRRRAARGTRASRSRWASAGSCGSWCLWSCSWRPSSPEPRRRSRCPTVDGNIGGGEKNLKKNQ